MSHAAPAKPAGPPVPVVKKDYTGTFNAAKADLPINLFFRQMIKFGGSDLHLQVGKPPMLRIKGVIRELQMDPIGPADMVKLCFPMMDARNEAIFHEEGGADYAWVVDHEGEPWRFRINLFVQMGKVGMVAVRSNARSPTSRG